MFSSGCSQRQNKVVIYGCADTRGTTSTTKNSGTKLIIIEVIIANGNCILTLIMMFSQLPMFRFTVVGNGRGKSDICVGVVSVLKFGRRESTGSSRSKEPVFYAMSSCVTSSVSFFFSPNSWRLCMLLLFNMKWAVSKNAMAAGRKSSVSGLLGWRFKFISNMRLYNDPKSLFSYQIYVNVYLWVASRENPVYEICRRTVPSRYIWLPHQKGHNRISCEIRWDDDPVNKSHDSMNPVGLHKWEEEALYRIQVVAVDF